MAISPTSIPAVSNGQPGAIAIYNTAFDAVDELTAVFNGWTTDRAASIPQFVTVGAGIDQTGVSNSAAAMQAIINTAATSTSIGARVYVPAGSYNIGSGSVGLTLPKGVDFVCDDQVLFTYSGTGTAILIDNWNENNTSRPGDGTGYVRIGRLRRSTVGWDTGADTTSIGLKLLNVNWSRVEIVECMNFATGVQTAGDADGTAYNNIYLGRITNNKINLGSSAINAGWTNGNNFYGGALRHSSGRSSYVGTRNVSFPSANGCTFTGINMEGSLTEETVYLNSVDNVLINCRFELAQKIHFGPSSYSNQIIGGYGLFGPNQRDASACHITYDAAITAAATTLTSATAVWTSGDVGKSITVFGAGASIPAFGLFAPLHTTVAAFTSGTSITLTDAAVTTVTAARQVTRRTAPNQVEILDDSTRNVVAGSRGSVSYAGGSFGADAAYTAWAINSNTDIVVRGRGINGNTYMEVTGNGRAGFIASPGKAIGSTTVFPSLRCDPSTSGPLGHPAFTAGRGNVEPDIALGRTAGNQMAWEASCPIVQKVVTATQASAGTTTFTMEQGDIFALTLNANNTGLTLSNPPQAGQVIILEIIQGGAGSFTWTAPTNAKFAGGTKGTTATVAGNRDIYTFRYDGTNWLETARSMNVG